MKLIKITLLLIVINICLHNATASSQDPDVIIFKGNSYPISILPLDELDTAATLNLPDLLGKTSGCWRGYIAHWRIKNDSMFLEKLLDPVYGKEISSHSVAAKKYPIKAAWYSGLLNFRTDEREYVYLIKKGDVICSCYFVIESGNRTGLANPIQCVIPKREIKDSEKTWIDPRYLWTPYMNEYKISGKQFSTRGELVRLNEICLLILDSNRVRWDLVEKVDNCDEVEILFAKTVEIKGHFTKVSNEYYLSLDEVKALGPNEVLHCPEFPY